MAAPDTPTPPASRGSIVGAVLFVLVIVGTLVFAIVAQMTGPPLEPARTFMLWQSLWNDGFYGAKYNFAVTWISLLVVLLGPVMLVAVSVDAIKAGRGQPAMPQGWRALAWKHMDRAARLRLGLGLTGIALLFGGVCLTDPTLLTPVGFLAQLALVLWPFTVIAGPTLVLDECLPERVVIGPVEALDREARGQSEVFHVKLAGKQFAVPEALWRQLTTNDTIAVRLGGGFDGVRAVAVRPRDPA